MKSALRIRARGIPQFRTCQCVGTCSLCSNKSLPYVVIGETRPTARTVRSLFELFRMFERLAGSLPLQRHGGRLGPLLRRRAAAIASWTLHRCANIRSCPSLIPVNAGRRAVGVSALCLSWSGTWPSLAAERISRLIQGSSGCSDTRQPAAVALGRPFAFALSCSAHRAAGSSARRFAHAQCEERAPTFGA